MATLGAGLTLGTWGKLRITSSVRAYFEHFWTVLAFAANSFLFLLLGMQVDLISLISAWDLVLWVILAMLVSRALVIFGLLPIVGLLPKVEPIGIRYRFIMFWGGLRGAISLAIVLSLPDYPFKDMFVALVTGAVLFTLLAQGLTMKLALRMLKLDRPPLADQLALLEREIIAHQKAILRLPALLEGGLFSSRVSHRIKNRSRKAIAKACTPVTLEKHDYLIHQGNHNDTLYMVTRGTISMQRYVRGEEEKLSTLIAGDSFGESILLGEGNADMSVIAQTPSRLYTLKRSRLLKMMAKDSELHGFLTYSDALQKSIHRPSQNSEP